MGDIQWPVLLRKGFYRRTLSKEIWRILVLVWSSHSSRISPGSFHHVPSCQCCHWHFCRILCSMLSDRFNHGVFMFHVVYVGTGVFVWIFCSMLTNRNLPIELSNFIFSTLPLVFLLDITFNVEKVVFFIQPYTFVYSSLLLFLLCTFLCFGYLLNACLSVYWSICLSLFLIFATWHE